jgi:hypothetical protein
MRRCQAMDTAALIRPTLTALALLIILLCSQPYSSAAFGGYSQHQKNVALHKLVPKQQQLTLSSSLLAKNTNGSNEENKRTYTKIDDGSPLGVAIVAIGGLLYSDPLGLFSGDHNNNPLVSLLQQDNSAWIIILTTASTAAGLERLFRYMRDKQQQ